MSDEKSKEVTLENVAGQPSDFEVEELDERSLEDVSGGTVSGQDITINEMQCNC